MARYGARRTEIIGQRDHLLTKLNQIFQNKRKKSNATI